MAAFKVGDVVQLKSGGPSMTVENVNQDEHHCIWFLNGKKQSDNFSGDALKEAKPDGAPFLPISKG